MEESDRDDQSSSGAHFVWTSWRRNELTAHLKIPRETKLMYNRLDANYHLANKKALFVNMSEYYKAIGLNPFEVAIPLTFHIKSG